MKDLLRNRIIIILLLALYLVLLPKQYFEYDYHQWFLKWALYIHQNGLPNAYNSPIVNYHPGFLYFLYLYDKLMGSEEMIIANLRYIKLLPMVFDFVPIIVLCCFRHRLITLRIPYLLLLLNIAYFFNSFFWGQIDSVHTNLSFLSLITAFFNPYAAVALFASALMFKMQAIIFAPILYIALLYSARTIKSWLLMAATFAGVCTLFLLPFILSGNAGKAFAVMTGAVDYYHNVSICAFNMWTLMLDDAYHTMDYTKFGPFTYKQIGLFFFILASAITLLPLLFRVIRYIKTNELADNNIKQLLMLTAGMISLYFFYFNTQMHERYAHPIIIFFFFYGVFSKNYKLYILASIPYFLTLEKVFPQLPIPHIKIIFAMKIIALWYTATLVYGMYLFFKEYKPLREWRAIKALK